MLQVFRLIKAFLQLKYGGQPLEWTLVTVQSQPIHSCDPLKTAHAGVHGLAGSMAKEYPGWQIRAVDLEAGREFLLKTCSGFRRNRKEIPGSTVRANGTSRSSSRFRKPLPNRRSSRRAACMW